MAQSNESILLGVPSYSPTQTMEPPHSWTHWSDQFQLAIKAKEKKRNWTSTILADRSSKKNQTPILEQAIGSKHGTEKFSRETRKKSAMKLYEAAKRGAEQKKKKIKSLD